MNVYRIKCLIIYSKLYKSPNDQRVLKFLFFVFVLVYLKTLKKENNYFFFSGTDKIFLSCSIYLSNVIYII